MTIQEAIKSGKRYKRPHHACWYTIENQYITTKDALATDWEVKEETVTLNRDQLIDACLVYMCSSDTEDKILDEIFKKHGSK